MKIFAGHGIADNVLPFHYGKEALSYLYKKGVNPVMKEYAAGHSITADEINDLVN